VARVFTLTPYWSDTMTSQYQVGQDVAILTNPRGMGDCQFEFSTVTKVTKSGQITLANGERYNKNGNEMKSARSQYPNHCIWDGGVQSAVDRIAQQDAYNAQQKKIKAILDAIAGQRCGNGTVHVSPELKAQLAAIVESL